MVTYRGGGNRTFRLRPRRAAFAQLQHGLLYRFKIVLSNVGMVASRFRVLQVSAHVCSPMLTYADVC
jgi:hypothetical protein